MFSPCHFIPSCLSDTLVPTLSGLHQSRSSRSLLFPVSPFYFLTSSRPLSLKFDLAFASVTLCQLPEHARPFCDGEKRPRKETYHIYTCTFFPHFLGFLQPFLNILKTFVLVFSTLCSFYLIKLLHPEAGRRLRKQPGPAHWTWNQIFKLSLQDSRCLLAGFQPLLVLRRSKCFKDLSFLRLE